jgi:1-acyl-sn-glycerol-3-phosphate acyltransferase
MIRLIIIILFLAIFFIISIPLFLVEWIIGKFSPRARDISSLRIVQGAFKVVLFITGAKTTVIGYENIPMDEAVLFVGNHRSFYDVIISYSMLPGLTGYISKKAIRKVPVLSTWMVLLHCLFLDRADVKQGMKTILTAIDQIKNGISITVFPEGTRNTGDGIMPFKGGSFKMAEKSGCKIVPVVQNNTSALFEDHLPRVKGGHTVIEFGKPIEVKDMSREEMKALPSMVREQMLEIYERNQRLV